VGLGRPGISLLPHDNGPDKIFYRLVMVFSPEPVTTVTAAADSRAFESFGQSGCYVSAGFEKAPPPEKSPPGLPRNKAVSRNPSLPSPLGRPKNV